MKPEELAAKYLPYLANKVQDQFLKDLQDALILQYTEGIEKGQQIISDILIKKTKS